MSEADSELIGTLRAHTDGLKTLSETLDSLMEGLRILHDRVVMLEQDRRPWWRVW